MHHVHSRLSVGSSAALAVSLIAGLATGQSRPAPTDVLDAFSLRAGTVQELSLPLRGGEAFQVAVILAGEPRVLNLRPYDVRSADFELLVSDSEGLHRVPTPASVTYRGDAEGMPGSIVAASLIDGQLTATVHTDVVTYGIQPLRDQFSGAPIASHVVYSGSDSIFPADVSCGTDHRAKDIPAQRDTRGVAYASAMKEVEIALDADLEFYQKNGSNVTQTQNKVTTVMNSVDAIYQRDVEIKHKITTIIVRTTRTYNPPLFNYMPLLLLSYQSYWNSNHTNIQRDVGHLFTGKGTFSGIIGVTLLGQICNLQNAYGASKVFSTSATQNVALVAHELGHSWNMDHCTGSTCYIMCATLAGCNSNVTRFGTQSISTIVSFKNSRPCLGTPTTSASFSVFGNGCAGSNGVPASGNEGVPQLGTNYAITLRNGVPNGSAVILLGNNTIEPPLNLGLFGAVGCLLYLSPDHSIPLPVNGLGRSTLSLQVPNLPGLIEAKLYSQWMSQDPGANPLSLTFSDAGMSKFGS